MIFHLKKILLVALCRLLAIPKVRRFFPFTVQFLRCFPNNQTAGTTEIFVTQRHKTVIDVSAQGSGHKEDIE